MVQGKWFASTEDISLPLRLRKAIFDVGRDASDEWAQQVVVYADPATPVGTARLSWKNGAFWIDGLGVLEEYRHQGFGDLLVRLCLFKSLTHNGKKIGLATPEALVPYFSKYGFRKSEVLSNGQTAMLIEADEIHLDCCGCKNCH